MKALEFAAMAGGTAPALHHYDRLGLLRPGRSHAGYRIYRESDLARLEQIVALKFLGLPLKQIRECSSVAAAGSRDPGPHCRRTRAHSGAAQIRYRVD